MAARAGSTPCASIVGTRGRVVEVAERGAGPARNAGVRASRGEAIAFIDSDCRPDRRWLEEGLAELQSADFAGGRVDVLVEDPRRMTAAEAFESVFAFQNERYVKNLNFTVTASMFVWRSVFDAVGGFENGVPEDLDWCRRARLKGYRIGFASRSIVQHPARRTMPELKRKSRRLTLEWCEAARRDGKGADLHPGAPLGGPVFDRTSCAGRHGVETPERNEKPHSGDRRLGANPGLSVCGRASGRPGLA